MKNSLGRRVSRGNRCYGRQPNRAHVRAYLLALFVLTGCQVAQAQTRKPCWRFVKPVPQWTSPLYCIPDSLHTTALRFAPITALVNGQRAYKMTQGQTLQLFAHKHGRPLRSLSVDHTR